ncbi:MAG: DUF167 domain-containing protein [Acidimicrobiales bacterium]|nr:DUF167 domain-containing protein [Acidimicrobiales bacterium]
MARPEVELLEIRVVPRASRNEVGEERAGRLIVRTTAAPVDDAANQAVRKLVARHLGVPMRDIEIIRGHNRRDKTLAIDRRTQPRES